MDGKKEFIPRVNPLKQKFFNDKLAIKGGKPVRKKPFPNWPIFGKSEKEALLRVLKSRKWFAGMLGSDEDSEVAKFEKSFAQYLGTKHVIAVSSGSAALEIALKSVGVGVGDEVIVPAFTFIATATSVLQINAIPIIVDIEPTYYCVDPERVEETITEKTVAIIPVHFGGQVAQMEKLLEIAKKHDLSIIEDAAHAHGSIYKGRKAGTFGKVGCFSFQESKTMTAGEGGAIVTQDDQVAELARSYRSCGRERGRSWYEHYRLGWNYRMTEFQGALLLAQLDRLQIQVRKRTENARFLSDLIDEIPGFLPVHDSPEMEQNGHYYYVVRIDRNYFPNLKKEKVIKALNSEGIPCHGGYLFSLQKNPMFRRENWDKHGFPYTSKYYGRQFDPTSVQTPIADRACRDIIIIPQRVLLAERKDMQDVAAAFYKVSIHAGELEDK